jgi:hypothetical protein
MKQDSVSVIIPHYNTPVEMNLCLDCLRYYTEEAIEIIVVDNGSPPEALDALRLRPGARLLERTQVTMDQEAHKDALDMGIASASGDQIVAIHSDCFMLCHGWLPFLKSFLGDGCKIAGPGSHKLYPPSVWEQLKHSRRKEPTGTRIRPVFTIFDTEVFAGARFSDYADVGGISVPYLEIGAARMLTRQEVIPYVFHLGGTTRLSILRHRPKALRRKSRQTAAFLKRPEIRRILSVSEDHEHPSQPAGRR